MAPARARNAHQHSPFVRFLVDLAAPKHLRLPGCAHGGTSRCRDPAQRRQETLNRRQHAPQSHRARCPPPHTASRGLWQGFAGIAGIRFQIFAPRPTVRLGRAATGHPASPRAHPPRVLMFRYVFTRIAESELGLERRVEEANRNVIGGMCRTWGRVFKGEKKGSKSGGRARRRARKKRSDGRGVGGTSRHVRGRPVSDALHPSSARSGPAVIPAPFPRNASAADDDEDDTFSVASNLTTRTATTTYTHSNRTHRSGASSATPAPIILPMPGAPSAKAPSAKAKAKPATTPANEPTQAPADSADLKAMQDQLNAIMSMLSAQNKASAVPATGTPLKKVNEEMASESGHTRSGGHQRTLSSIQVRSPVRTPTGNAPVPPSARTDTTTCNRSRTASPQSGDADKATMGTGAYIHKHPHTRTHIHSRMHKTESPEAVM